MKRALAVTRLQFNKKLITLGVPAMILALVVLVSVIIALTMQRFGVDPTTPEYADGFKMSGGAVYSIPGFLVYLGVQAVSLTFPFAMSLGTTRRSYALGTALFYALQAFYVGLISVVLLGIEKLTGHWFVGAYVFDTHMAGDGNFVKVFLTMTVVTFVALCVGGVFGGVFLRLGSKGPLALSIALVLVLALLLLFLAPQLTAIAAATTRWHILGVLSALALASVGGLYLALRRATVR